MSKSGIVIFLAGGIIGSVSAWFVLKKKYEQIAQEEIDSVKAIYTVKKAETECNEPAHEPITVNEPITEHTKLKPDIIEFATKLRETGYVKYEEHFDKIPEEKEQNNLAKAPYVISPDQFSEGDEYDKITLTYYDGDGILADDNDEIINEVDEVVGDNFVDHFGEYEEDSVYVRNDILRCDYEICKDLRSYKDVANPY